MIKENLSYFVSHLTATATIDFDNDGIRRMRKIRTSLKPASLNNEHNVVIENNLMSTPSHRGPRCVSHFPVTASARFFKSHDRESRQSRSLDPRRGDTTRSHRRYSLLQPASD